MTENLIVGKVDEMLAACRNGDIMILNIDPRTEPVEGWAQQLTRLATLPADRQPAFTFMVFDGFNDDPREVYDIPDCIEWTQALVRDHFGALLALSDERTWDVNVRGEYHGFGRIKVIGCAGHASIIKDHSTGKLQYVMHKSGLALLSMLNGAGASC